MSYRATHATATNEHTQLARQTISVSPTLRQLRSSKRDLGGTPGGARRQHVELRVQGEAETVSLIQRIAQAQGINMVEPLE